MAILQISEFSGRPIEQYAGPIDALGYAVATQKVTIGAEADSAAFNPKTKLVRLYAEADCCIAFGAGNPTATNKASANPSDVMPAGSVEVRWVNPGDAISVIAA